MFYFLDQQINISGDYFIYSCFFEGSSLAKTPAIKFEGTEAKKLQISHSTFYNWVGNNGGAIYANEKVTLLLSFICFSNCVANQGSAVYFVDTSSSQTGPTLQYLSISIRYPVLYIKGNNAGQSQLSHSNFSKVVSFGFYDLLTFDSYSFDIRYSTFSDNLIYNNLLYFNYDSTKTGTSTLFFCNIFSNRIYLANLVDIHNHDFTVRNTICQLNTGEDFNKFYHDGNGELKYIDSIIDSTIPAATSYAIDYYQTYNCLQNNSYVPPTPDFTPDSTPFSTTFSTPFSTPSVTSNISFSTKCTHYKLSRKNHLRRFLF